MEATAESDVIKFQEEFKAEALTPGQLVRMRFMRHKMAVFGLIVLFLLIFYSFGGAFIYTEAEANYTDTKIRLSASSAEHPFGTDTVGRDILIRTIYGGQISLLIGLSAVVVEVILGVIIGAVAGYYGGWIDGLLMRFTEA
ncbi:MAG: peptide ABC transporter permease, partial [Chloroflexi bacterium]|nr:peptide ABC transporter permease [Chloroflexota bacterium]